MMPVNTSQFQTQSAFSGLPVNLTSPVQTEQKKRTGLMRAAIGASFPVRCKDGKVRAFTVRAAELLKVRLAELRKDPKTAPTFICFHQTCRARTWTSEEALLGDHPDIRAMAESGEAHVYALWSEAPEIVDKTELASWHVNEASQSALAMRLTRKEDPIVGLLSE